MARIHSTVSETVERYRKVAAAQRGLQLQELDAEVWNEYMKNHPLTAEPEYSGNERNNDE